MTRKAIQKQVPHLVATKAETDYQTPTKRFLANIRTRSFFRPEIFGSEKHINPSSSYIKTGVSLPPAPKGTLSPNSYPCFRDKEALNDTCKAFQCFGEMTDCGATGYIRSSKALYCDGINQYIKKFNNEGQKFLKCLQQTVTKKHVAIFNQGIIPCCNSLANWGFGEMQQKALMSCGFCKPMLFISNAGAFGDLFDHDGTENITSLWMRLCKEQESK